METLQNCPDADKGSKKEDHVCDMEQLFGFSNETFFWNKLRGVHIVWSDLTTSPAQCSYNEENGVCITLNGAMLARKFRRDAVNLLLHEMIHAYLMVTENERSRNIHSSAFQTHMHRINRQTGTNITILHGFHVEHVWQCLGPCRHRRPLFGVVRKVVDKPPGPNDMWWAEHKTTCTGIFVKVKDAYLESPKTVKKSHLESQTEECVAAAFKNSFNLDLDTGYRYDCPFCFGLYSETQLRRHLDQCAATKGPLLSELFDVTDQPQHF